MADEVWLVSGTRLDEKTVSAINEHRKRRIVWILPSDDEVPAWIMENSIAQPRLVSKTDLFHDKRMVAADRSWEIPADIEAIRPLSEKFNKKPHLRSLLAIIGIAPRGELIDPDGNASYAQLYRRFVAPYLSEPKVHERARSMERAFAELGFGSLTELVNLLAATRTVTTHPLGDPRQIDSIVQIDRMKRWGVSSILNYYRRGQRMGSGFGSAKVRLGGQPVHELPVALRPEWTCWEMPLSFEPVRPDGDHLHVHATAERPPFERLTDEQSAFVDMHVGHLGQVVQDNLHYRLSALECNLVNGARTLTLNYTVGTFLEYKLRSAGGMQNELMAAVSRAQGSPLDREMLPIRAAIAPRLEDLDLTRENLKHRVCLGGVSCLTVQTLGGTPRFLWSWRSARTSDNPELAQSLPQGFHQLLDPATVVVHRHIAHTVTREFLEELEGYREAQDPTGHAETVNRVMERRETLRRQAKVWITGISVCMVTGTYQLYVLIVVDSSWNLPLTPNWESKGRDAGSSEATSQATLGKKAGILAGYFEAGDVGHNFPALAEWVPFSLVAMANGLPIIRKLVDSNALNVESLLDLKFDF